MFPFDDKDLSARFLTQERAVDRDTRNARGSTVPELEDGLAGKKIEVRASHPSRTAKGGQPQKVVGSDGGKSVSAPENVPHEKATTTDLQGIRKW